MNLLNRSFAGTSDLGTLFGGLLDYLPCGLPSRIWSVGVTERGPCQSAGKCPSPSDQATAHRVDQCALLFQGLSQRVAFPIALRILKDFDSVCRPSSCGRFPMRSSWPFIPLNGRLLPPHRTAMKHRKRLFSSSNGISMGESGKI